MAEEAGTTQTTEGQATAGADAGSVTGVTGGAAGDAKGQPQTTEVKTALTAGEGEGGDKGAVTPDFPDDWREKLAGGDEKRLGTLKRYTSPKSVMDAYFALRQKMSAGELKEQTPFPEKGTDEEKAAWRKTNGLPDKPDGYDAALPDGLVIGDADKPVIAEFHKAMHEVNAPPEVVKAAKGAYYKIIETRQAERAQKDEAARVETEDQLRAEWGNEYRGNVNAVLNFLDGVPGDGTKDMLLHARLADGTPVFSNPDVVRWFANLAREANPAATLVKGGGDQLQSIDTELDQIRKVMRENRKAYNKDTKMQERYRQLLTAKEKLGGRAA